MPDKRAEDHATTNPDQPTPQIAVWHRNDLRTRDNKALSEATTTGLACPVFIIDPQFYRNDMACDARLRFLHQSLVALDAQYTELGSHLVLKEGNPTSILNNLPVEQVFVNRSVTSRYGRNRDETIFSQDNVTVFEADGIDWTDRPREAYDWQAHAEDYFEHPPLPTPDQLHSNPLTSTTTVPEVEATYTIRPKKRNVPPGGESAAWRRVEAFAENLDAYPGGISPPAEAERRTSGLSPYFKFGCLTPRAVYQYITTHCPDDQARAMFEDRLFWNRHYSQKLADWPGWTETAVNPVFRSLFRSTHDPELVRAWKAGETGFPLVDASMRALRETGRMNFRMRAMCASFFHYILQCWWRVGADHYYRELIDADPAINYAQWQNQCNLTGVHPVRIYNPRKQVRENDPDGNYITKYVPELADFPVEYLDQPERAPRTVQAECGITIGEDYPRPIVDFENKRGETRDIYARLTDRAMEVMQEDPEIRHRASLSKNRLPDDTPVEEMDLSDDQAAISDFESND